MFCLCVEIMTRIYFAECEKVTHNHTNKNTNCASTHTRTVSGYIVFHGNDQEEDTDEQFEQGIVRSWVLCF